MLPLYDYYIRKWKDVVNMIPQKITARSILYSLVFKSSAEISSIFIIFLYNQSYDNNNRNDISLILSTSSIEVLLR